MVARPCPSSSSGWPAPSCSSAARLGFGHRAATLVHLEPLSADDIGDLLRGLVPGLPEPVLRQTVERAGGVPLYAVETVRMLLDEGRLTLAGERYRLTNPTLRWPRLRHCRPSWRLASMASIPRNEASLHDAAVLGKSFSASALAAVSAT